MLTKEQITFRLRMTRACLVIAAVGGSHAVFMQDKALIALWMFMVGWNVLSYWALSSLQDQLPDSDK